MSCSIRSSAMSWRKSRSSLVAAPMSRSKRSASRKRLRTRLRSLRPGGTLSSLGVYSGKLQVPYDAFAAGLGDYKIVTTLCPGGKERMRRLMSMVQSKRFDPLPLLTHQFQARSNRRSIRSLWLAPRRLPESCYQAITKANHRVEDCKSAARNVYTELSAALPQRTSP